MNEQQQEQPQEYGMDYAMHRHDIERIEVTCHVNDTDMFGATVIGVNTRLRQGWALLAIGQVGNLEDGTDPEYIMGVPRPKFCDDYDHDGHRIQMFWRHEKKRWTCKVCDCLAAIAEDDCYNYRVSVGQPG